MIPRLRESGVEQADMSDGSTIAPARDARNHRGASRVLNGGTAVSPTVRSRAVLPLRSVEDIDAIEAAGAVVAQALDRARQGCVAGVTTSDLDAIVREHIIASGAQPIFLGYRGSASSNMANREPYPASTCISVNEELVHGVPGDRVIRSGDMVSIDAGARLDGWCADSAITVCVGEVSTEACALLDCAEEMLSHAVAVIRPGIRWSMVARELEQIAVDAGFSVAVDFVGHGIGRELHEPPQVPCSVYASYLESGDFTLRPGMVLAVEPMVVAEPPQRNARGELVSPAVTLADDGWTVVVNSGAASCHVEHTIAVTREGCRILTSTSNQARGAAPVARRAG